MMRRRKWRLGTRGSQVMSKRQVSIELNCSRTTVYRVISSDKDRGDKV
ncbi:helix-turn-helix domain-containing protein [Vibrio gallaecicus]|uniref:Helix-turn-helix domain-containing protein n=1 Tax=Vibrio gallaecicus TaxID=552386 RepID=A0ABV4NH63_9VIBR